MRTPSEVNCEATRSTVEGGLWPRLGLIPSVSPAPDQKRRNNGSDQSESRGDYDQRCLRQEEPDDCRADDQGRNGDACRSLKAKRGERMRHLRCGLGPGNSRQRLSHNKT